MSLRSFVEQKLNALETYTSLPYINRVEMVLYDLPIEPANMFLVNKKVKSNKTDLLEFCDSIQELVQTMNVEDVTSDHEMQTIRTKSTNRMEIFDFDPDMESDDFHSMPSTSRGRSSSRGRGPGCSTKRKTSNESFDRETSGSGSLLSETESLGKKRKK